MRRAGEPLAAQGDEITRRPGPFVTDEVLEQSECELDVSADRSAAENRRPAERDGDRTGKNVLGALAGLEHEAILEPCRQREGVSLVRTGDTQACPARS